MMAVGMLVLLFVGSCAYDDEQSVLLQAGIKNHVNTTHSQGETTQCADDPNYEDIDGDGCAGQYANNPEGLCGVTGGYENSCCGCCSTCKGTTKCAGIVCPAPTQCIDDPNYEDIDGDGCVGQYTNNPEGLCGISGGYENSCCGCCATCKGTTKCAGVVCPTRAPMTKPYHQTEKGADSCPGAALTSTECEAAAVSYGLPWDRVDKWSNGLAGCFTNGQKVYFNTDQTGTTPNPKWSLICQAPEDDDEYDYDDYVEPTEPTCLKDKCFRKRDGKIKRRKCESHKNGCALCTECDEKPEDRSRCEDKCYDNDGELKKRMCAKNKCAACTGC